MKVIGLTGGIASGKSTVAKILQAAGASCIDADQLGHQTYLKGKTAYKLIIDAFGRSVLNQDGEIERKILGSIVFSDPKKMQVLNEIVWPEIGRLIDSEIKSIKKHRTQYPIVVEAAVLFSAQWHGKMDEIWLIYTPKEIALNRLIHRNKISREDAEKRFSLQISYKDFMNQADVVVYNDGSSDALKEKIESLRKTIFL